MGWLVGDALCLAIDEVGKKKCLKLHLKFLLVHLDGYLFSVAHGNTYLPKSSNEYVLYMYILYLHIMCTLY